jgi:hypothetical protein
VNQPAKTALRKFGEPVSRCSEERLDLKEFQDVLDAGDHFHAKIPVDTANAVHFLVARVGVARTACSTSLQQNN